MGQLAAWRVHGSSQRPKEQSVGQLDEPVEPEPEPAFLSVSSSASKWLADWLAGLAIGRLVVACCLLLVNVARCFVSALSALSWAKTEKVLLGFLG